MPFRSNTALVVISLVAGLLVGFALSTTAYRMGWLEVPGEAIVRRMNRVLALTPAQRERTEEILEDTRAKVAELRRDLEHQRRELLLDAYGRIREALTPDQQETFDRQIAPPEARKSAAPQPTPQGAPS